MFPGLAFRQSESKKSRQPQLQFAAHKQPTMVKWCIFFLGLFISVNRLNPISGLSEILIALSRSYHLGRSWELRTWSLDLNSLDILTASPHYFCKKFMVTRKENF